MLYVSGISSRNPDNSYRGVTKHADGSTTLSIAEQTRGVLDNMKNILSAAGQCTSCSRYSLGDDHESD